MRLALKYGCNPHQSPAYLQFTGATSPLEILNGAPGYINLLDAFNAWQLAKELKAATGKPGAASFKHVSPAGAAIAKQLSDDYARSQFLEKTGYSETATAYIRARGGDRMCSYGDVAAVSDKVDVSLAAFLKNEVCDLVIAPDYDPKALEILKEKKKGEFVILRMDPSYEPAEFETRQFYGFEFGQPRNAARVTADLFTDIVTKNRSLSPSRIESLIVATIALKYTQSNSICIAYEGQVIGVGAGQQSRIHCTRLACEKAEKWLLQQQGKILDLRFPEGLKKFDKANAIDQVLRWDDLSEEERERTGALVGNRGNVFSADDRTSAYQKYDGICLSSDAYFPFRDNIDRASGTNISCIAHAGGSLRDTAVVDAADEHGMVLIRTGLRLFTH
jgi:phosphoribosylaminoimidazolecarboxamide formyltransferase / IMP cyclohydrolase